ncbi:MAG: hypothetical protein Ta2A_05980 [Treponemataceae bacterium]|nr:MAG: hypothetical protein Ta2A_05980 [Treponemataceae bacterium]
MLARRSLLAQTLGGWRHRTQRLPQKAHQRKPAGICNLEIREITRKGLDASVACNHNQPAEPASTSRQRNKDVAPQPAAVLLMQNCERMDARLPCFYAPMCARITASGTAEKIMQTTQAIHENASKLNKILDSSVAGCFLSDLGRRIYFPHGIIAQGGEAKRKASFANATIGMMTQNGIPVILDEIASQLPELTAAQIVAYSPTAGNDSLRLLWRELMLKKNPALQDVLFSVPVVVPGLTAGLSTICDLFVNAGDSVIAAEPSWDNYQLIVEARRSARLRRFDIFDTSAIGNADSAAARFCFESFEKVVAQEAKSGCVRLLLNFPHNPSGYSLYRDEAKKLCAFIEEKAKEGTKFLIISDDAYFGLNFEDGIETQSLFAYFATLHKNVLAVKLDGPTKEDYVWGLRCGFLTFASLAFDAETVDALTQKLMGLLRSSVSCSSTPAQTLVLKAYQMHTLEKSREKFALILKQRCDAVRAITEKNKAHPFLKALPFNSGYFMSFFCKGLDAEELRLKLLTEHKIGTISINPHVLRVAFSSLDMEQIAQVYETIYRTAEELGTMQ